jgi:hypothetical protein
MAESLSAFSLAHGAGRKWSRSDSRARLEKRFSAKDLVRTELGSHVICEDKELLFGTCQEFPIGDPLNLPTQGTGLGMRIETQSVSIIHAHACLGVSGWV